MIGRFSYLKLGLAAILVFVGAKMLVSDLYHMPIWLSLTVIAAALLVSIVASLRRSSPAVASQGREPPHDPIPSDAADPPPGPGRELV